MSIRRPLTLSIRKDHDAFLLEQAQMLRTNRSSIVAVLVEAARRDLICFEELWETLSGEVAGVRPRT